MNEAIEAAKASQKIVAKMSLDHREKVISNIRKKIMENAEILARMGVQETGMGNVGHKILKHQLVAEKTPGTEDITTQAWSGRQRSYIDRDGTVRSNRSDHTLYKPK